MKKILLIYSLFICCFSCDTYYKKLKPKYIDYDITYCNIIVDSQWLDCNYGGSKTRKCLNVKFENSEQWQPFYSDIEGFDYKLGYQYKLTILIKRIEEVSSDTPHLKYVLVRQISKIKV